MTIFIFESVIMTMLADRITFDFFCANSPRESHCCHYCLVSDVKWSIHISFTIKKRRKNSSWLRLNNAKRSHTITIGANCTQTRHPYYGSFLITTWSFKVGTTQPCDMWSRTLSISNRPTDIVDFFNCFGWSEPNWPSLELIRPQRNLVKHFFIIKINVEESR